MKADSCCGVGSGMLSRRQEVKAGSSGWHSWEVVEPKGGPLALVEMTLKATEGLSPDPHVLSLTTST